MRQGLSFFLLYPLRACYIFQNYSLRYICFYDDLEKSLVREGIVTFYSLLHYKVDIFLKIMCCLNSKYNRKMCVVENPQASSSNFTSYLIKGVLYFYFLTVVLAMYCSTSERFLKSRLLASRFNFTLSYPYHLEHHFLL